MLRVGQEHQLDEERYRTNFVVAINNASLPPSPITLRNRKRLVIAGWVLLRLADQDVPVVKLSRSSQGSSLSERKVAGPERVS